MRALHVITTISNLGGAENHLLILLRELAARGHRVDLTWLKAEGQLADRFRDAGCDRVFKTPFERRLQAPAAILGLRREISDNGYDIVHTHLLKADAIGGAAAALSRPRPAAISTKHNDEPVLKKPFAGRIHGMLSRSANDRVICISDHVRKFMNGHGRIPPNLTERIYYGFDRSLYPSALPADVRTEFSLPDDSFVFGIVGRLTEQKNHLLLLPAFAEIAVEYPQAYLLIVGGDGYSPDYRRKVERTIAELGLTGRAILTGWREDAYSLMGGLDCMVLPSAWEGLGVVFLEALSLGVPVIATRASAIPEIVRDGIDGILVEPEDPEGLRRALACMIEDAPTIRSRTRSEGPAYVTRSFSVGHMVDETIAVYEAALNRRAHRTGDR